MNIKALITAIVLGTSSTALADTAFSASAHGSFRFGTPAPVVMHPAPAYAPPAPIVRDHRTHVGFDRVVAFDDRYDRHDRHDRHDRGWRQERFDVSGVYTSNHGTVRLSQRGNKVTGTYNSDGNVGYIDGYITRDGMLVYHWKENPGEGSGVWYLGGRGRSIHGTWKTVDNTSGGEWNLIRVR